MPQDRLDWTAPALRGPLALCALASVLSLAGALACGLAFHFSAPLAPLLGTGLIALGLVAVSAFYSARRPDKRIAALAAGAAFLIVFSLLGAAYSYTSAAANLPLLDARFAAADQALGFDWPSHLRFVVDHPQLFAVLHVVYKLATPALAIVVLVLGATLRTERLAQFCAAYAVTGAAVVTIAAFAPGFGGYAHYALDPDLLQRMPVREAGQEHYADLAALRAGTLRVIPFADMQGLVTLPSFHTALAVICAWALWPIRRLALPFAALNAAIVAATPTMGGHHLVDLISGAALAGAAIALAKASSRQLADTAEKNNAPKQVASGAWAREVSPRPAPKAAAGAAGFAFAGVVGFAVDAGVTTALTALGAGPAAARIPAIFLAILATFLLNRRIAFGPSGRSVPAEFARYVAVSAAGALVSFAAYLVALAILARLGAPPTPAATVAVAFGSGFGMIANYLGYRGFAFAPARPR